MAEQRKAQIVAPSAASEPSEPSALRPEDKPQSQIQGEQEENPQLIAHRPGRQEANAKGRNAHREGDGDRIAEEGFAGATKPRL